MKIYTVQKGNHYSAHLPEFHFGITRLVFDFIFDDSCVYNHNGIDQFDWNKVYGLGFGLNHHKNSYRVGSRWDLASGRMELGHYYYNNYVRSFPTMCSVELNQQCNSYISLDKRSNTIWNTICVFVDGREEIIYSDGINFDFKGVPSWGLMLDPYFGGNKVAVRDYNLKLERIR